VQGSSRDKLPHGSHQAAQSDDQQGVYNYMFLMLSKCIWQYVHCMLGTH